MRSARTTVARRCAITSVVRPCIACSSASCTRRSLSASSSAWIVIILLAAFAVAPWWRQLRFSFSLRTLLIATTLVAVLLGLVAWMGR